MERDVGETEAPHEAMKPTVSVLNKGWLGNRTRTDRDIAELDKRLKKREARTGWKRRSSGTGTTEGARRS
jgi:hypothetical protein